MREFSKFSPEFWSGPLAEQLKLLGSNALLLATYLQTNRHSNMLGVYYLPLAYISHDTGIELKEIKELLAALSDYNFCHYDYLHSYVWVVELAGMQTGGSLKEGDKRVIFFKKQFESLPNLLFLSEIYQKYHVHFHLDPLATFDATSMDLTCPMEGPSMPHRCKKKEKKNKKENKNKKEKDNIVSFVDSIFAHWKQVMNHPNARLDEKRRSLIRKALASGYSEAQICQAITGCSYTPHNMGINEQGQRYDGLHVILKNADQIDRFISNYNSPPKRLSKNDELVRNNALAVQTWLEEPEDPRHAKH